MMRRRYFSELEAMEREAGRIWPGVKVVPTMLTGATDARHFNAVGIPTYGVTAVFNDPDGNGVHGQNERVRVSSVDEGRRFVLGEFHDKRSAR